VHKIDFLVPKVCCWLSGVRLGCGLDWLVMGPQFLLCDGLDWVSRLMGTLRPIHPIPQESKHDTHGR